MLIRSFREWFVVGILSFEKCFGVDVLDFQIELFSRYFGLLAAVLATFCESWVIFLLSSSNSDQRCYWRYLGTLVF